MSKLSEGQVSQIYELLDAGEERKEIAKAFGISAASVTYWDKRRPVKRNRPSWKSIAVDFRDKCYAHEKEIATLKKAIENRITENRVLAQNQKDPQSNGATATDMTEIVAKFKMFRQFMELSKEL